MIRTLLLLSLFLTVSSVIADETVQFNREIRPVLSNNCFVCHGPDEENRQADMRLDVASEIDFEEVVARITSTDPELRMPPPESHKELKPEQIELLRRWIDQGAPYEKHWAFAAPKDYAIPPTRDDKWSEQPIDRFVLAGLEKLKLSPNNRADKRTLIRRLTLDLTGLPPTRKEIEDFINESSAKAYEKLVDRLLASPHYGEHMARYWLDLVRFADTNGLHHDHYREMTPYRDWVIRSFNDNLPFDEFLVYQMAGDLYEDPSVDQQIASGFNRLHLIIDRGTALPEESFNRNVVDRVSAVGTAFLGLTVQCAVCHDHKYDPITQKDFYQLYAFFNNFDGEPETGSREGLDFKRGLQPPYLELPSQEQKKKLMEYDAKISKLEERIESAKSQRLPVSASSSPAPEKDNSKKFAPKLKQLETQRNQLMRRVPATLVMKERREIRPAHILVRGAYDQPGDRVERDTPSFLPPLKKQTNVATRMDLARWLTDSSHPLTARVATNRFWQQFFGVGLVRTSEDFGAQGELPSHPKLLDYLTLQFIESGWDVKALVRLIVLSKTYQQSSRAPRERYLTDPSNRFLARGSRFRLDAEVIRDQVLTVTGLLNPERFGMSVKPPQPKGLWKIVSMPSSYPNSYKPDRGEKMYRRSVYTFWRRSLPPPQMTIFDAPTRESCIARRERTNTPLQALLLMNEQQFFAASMHYANHLLQNASQSDQERMQEAYESITSQLPSQEILSPMFTALQEFRLLYSKDTSAADSMITSNAEVLSSPRSDPQYQTELAAWTMLVHSLLNLDTTKTHE